MKRVVILKKIGYLFLGLVGILIFILQVFVFESPDGFLGYIVCLTSMLITVISLIRLCQISKSFCAFFKELIDLLLFWSV